VCLLGDYASTVRHVARCNLIKLLSIVQPCHVFTSNTIRCMPL
jgi:hypothetical protein